MKEKVLVSWSGGKDCALALHAIRQDSRYEVVALLTTVLEEGRMVAMHLVPEVLIERQARAAELPLEKVAITRDMTGAAYADTMRAVLGRYQDQGVSSVVSGDLFLEDLRQEREDKLASIGMKALFPLWQHDTLELARGFVSQGFKAVIMCVDLDRLDRGFVGCHLDDAFLDVLPAGVDPCGENGEYHSFVYNGPVFREPIQHTVGSSRHQADHFNYCEIHAR